MTTGLGKPMSSRGDHDSMDDVLASIRRIVRAETKSDPEESKAADRSLTGADAEDGVASEAEAPPAEHVPDAGTGDVSEKTAPAAISDQNPDDAAPLLLTPEMRADRAGGHEVKSGAPAGTAAPAASAPEREILRMLIAEIVAAEMRGDAIRDILRDIIRDELTNGPLGKNASQNVRAMIRAEIAASRPEEH